AGPCSDERVLHELSPTLEAAHVGLDSHGRVGCPGPEPAVAKDSGAGGSECGGGLLRACAPVWSVEDVAGIDTGYPTASEPLPCDDGSLVGLAPALGDAGLRELVG